MVDTTNAWHPRLYKRLREQPYPLFVFGDMITPAASVWAATRLWTDAFRGSGLHPGDRVVIALPPSVGFLGAFLAGLWEGLTIALLPPMGDVEGAAGWIDATATIAGPGSEATWQADACGLPEPTGRGRRRADRPPTPEARLLLSTSGTTAAPRWVALSDVNLLSVLDSHLPHLGLDEARVLSVLPWHHVFGLMIDLLPALIAGAEIIRDDNNGRDPARLRQLIQAHGITHLNGVPLMYERLFQVAGGAEAAERLHGVVGGAPVSRGLAACLRRTRLRAGYGQTEASPGIALGEPGRWEAGYLGQPLGCQVRVDSEGQLQFTGANACLGFWEDAGLQRHTPHRWVDTGDIVRSEGKDLFFRARADDAFKLSNGRRVQAGLWENALRERSPQLEQALLYTPDGERLEVLVSRPLGAPRLTLSLAREVLGSLGTRLCGVRELPPGHWFRTPKGDMDRRAILQHWSDAA